MERGFSVLGEEAEDVKSTRSDAFSGGVSWKERC